MTSSRGGEGEHGSGPWRDVESHRLCPLADGAHRCRENMKNVASHEHEDSPVLYACAHHDVGITFNDHSGAGAIDTV